MQRLSEALLLVLATYLLVGCQTAISGRTVDGGRYGDVKLFTPRGQPRGLVIFFTDRYGLSETNEAVAVAIAKSGALVVEVNTRSYLNRLDTRSEKCHQVFRDAEELSQNLQRALNFPNYLTPILAGTGEGGTLAELALAEAPAVTIAGAVSLDPSATIRSREPICVQTTVQPSPSGFSYGSFKSLHGYWNVALLPQVSPTDRDYISTLRGEGAPVVIQTLRGRLPIPEELATLIAPHLTKLEVEFSGIDTLPLVAMPVGRPSKLMAGVLSGDGGWRDLDKTIAQDLQQEGVPVVGWDSLRYFWSTKSPGQTSIALAIVIRTFMSRWQAKDVALIGYSFGADVLPFAYNRLPEDVRSHVALIALLALANTADFEIRVNGWLGLPAGPGALPILPAAEKIPPRLIQCYYEVDTACPQLAKDGAQVFRTAGGHHFDGNYRAMEREILAGFEQRVESSIPNLRTEKRLKDAGQHPVQGIEKRA